MATLSRIAVHPIKSLDPAEPAKVAISDIGGLVDDRAYAIVDGEGRYVNGKRTDAVHRIRADYDLDAGTVEMGPNDGDRRRFGLREDRTDLEAWLSEFLGTPVTLEAAEGGGLTDGVVYGEGASTGPTLVSEATLEAAASWFEGIDVEGMRRRLRPNLVVSGVEAFWEDRLVAGGGRAVRIGDVRLEGERPIPRCVVPTRDPWTGEPYDGFRERFEARREATLPAWAPSEGFDHFFTLMVGLRIPEGHRAGALQLGDPVEVA